MVNDGFTILVVEDEAAIREMVNMTLSREGYHVVDCETAEEAETILSQQVIHLVLLDWMLPGISGVRFIEKIRGHKKLKDTPIIMLTARAEEDDKLVGFNAGADDYISKPFSLKEMLARVQSILRRSYAELNDNTEQISLHGLTIDKVAHLVHTEENEEIHLGPTEFKLLLFLMENPGRVYSREQLLDSVWGIGVYVDERTVDVHIRRLRRALEKYHLEKVIRTIRGSGYSFAKPNK